MIICKIRSGTFGIKFENILDLSLFLIPISFICARLYYVAFNLPYYIENPSQILNIKSGGLAIYGAIIGGIITCIIFCKIRKIKILDLLDYVAPSLALGQAIGRWGNFVNIEAYGGATQSFLRMGIIENGNYIEVHPTFLYESIITFILFLILINIKDKNIKKENKQKKWTRKYPGQITYIYFIVYSFARFFIEGIRTDSLMLFDFKISQILSLLLFVIFCSILANKEINHYKM